MKYIRLFFSTVNIVSWLIITFRSIREVCYGIYGNHKNVFDNFNLYKIYTVFEYLVTGAFLILFFIIIGGLGILVNVISTDHLKEMDSFLVPWLTINSILTFLFFLILYVTNTPQYILIMIFPLLYFVTVVIKAINNN